MNTTETSYTGRAVTVHSEEPAAVIEVEREDLSAFFTVGIIINIVMVTAYFVWAFKQWGKTGARDE